MTDLSKVLPTKSATVDRNRSLLETARRGGTITRLFGRIKSMGQRMFSRELWYSFRKCSASLTLMRPACIACLIVDTKRSFDSSKSCAASVARFTNLTPTAISLKSSPATDISKDTRTAPRLASRRHQKHGTCSK